MNPDSYVHLSKCEKLHTVQPEIFIPSHPVMVLSRPTILLTIAPKNGDEKRRVDGTRGLLGQSGLSSSPGSPTEKTKIRKKLPSIDRVSYTPASCIHSSLPGNQCGSYSYMLLHEPITVKVYTSQEQCHLPPMPFIPLRLDRRNAETPGIHTTLANQIAHLHSLSMPDHLAQGHHLSGLPLIKLNILIKSPEDKTSHTEQIFQEQVF